MAENQTATRRGRPVMTLDVVGRRSFGVTKRHSDRLAQGHSRLGRSDPFSGNRS